MKYIIRSLNRPEDEGFFVAFHGYTAFYSSRDHARRFDSIEAARDYANKELFSDPTAFVIVTATATPFFMKFQIKITSEAMNTTYEVSSTERVAAQIMPIIEGLNAQGAESYTIEIKAQK